MDAAIEKYRNEFSEESGPEVHVVKANIVDLYTPIEGFTFGAYWFLVADGDYNFYDLDNTTKENDLVIFKRSKHTLRNRAALDKVTITTVPATFADSAKKIPEKIFFNAGATISFTNSVQRPSFIAML